MNGEALLAAVTIRDLTDPEQGPHAMQLLMNDVVDRLRAQWGCRMVTHRCSPITTVRENYDRLHYPPEGISRDARHTRYLAPNLLLRTHATAMVPSALRVLAGARVQDVLLVCPGLVYRRDCIDRLHTGEPHQLDLWRLYEGPPASEQDLEQMIAMVVEAALPDVQQWHCTPAQHSYTERGRQIDIRMNERWIEIGECGLADPSVLREAGLPTGVTGLAMGLGLDRLLMLRKKIEDIRLLRSSDPRVRRQLTDLSVYRLVSRQPAVTRDMSIAVHHRVDAELLGDRVREVLGEDADCVEELVVVAETPYADLPAAAVTRLGIDPCQKNVLLRVVIRHLNRSLTRQEANAIRDRIYVGLHEGSNFELSPIARR